MTIPILGQPHSMRRYAIYAAIAGVLAGVIASALHLGLAPTAAVASVLGALAAGYAARPRAAA